MTVTDRLYGFDTGASFKQACYVASTANLTLSSTQSIDGIHASTGVRVLVKDQTTASENGIYEVRASAWARAADCDGARDVVPGTMVYVDRGTAYGDTIWTFNSSSTALTIAIDTDDITLTNITPTVTETSGGSVTATGSTASRTLADRFADWVNVKDFGATGNGTTDDTAAIQAAINYCATNGLYTVFFPSGEYNFSRLFLHYDAINNTGYPSDDEHLGRIRLKGVGGGSYRNVRSSDDADQIGTTLICTGTANDAIYCNGDPLGLDESKTDAVQIEDLSVIGTMDANVALIRFDRVVQGSGLRNVIVKQLGAGDGVHWSNCYQTFLEDVLIEGFDEGHATAATSGTGLYMYNDNIAGGFVKLHRVTSNFWTLAGQLGHKTAGSAVRLHGIHLVNCQFGDSTTGLKIGAGINQLRWEACHTESCDLGVEVGYGADNIHFAAGSIVNCDVGMSLGDNTGAGNGDNFEGVEAIGVQFQSDAATTIQLRIYASSATGTARFVSCKHIGNAGATDTGIWLEDAGHHGIEFIYPVLGANLTTPTTNINQAQLYVLESQFVWRAPSTAALSAPPFQFVTNSSVVAQPPVLIGQATPSVALFEIRSTNLTPAASSTTASVDNITLSNSTAGSVTGPNDGLWTYYGAVRAVIADAGASTHYYIPLFTRNAT